MSPDMKPTTAEEAVRPTKKQKELLTFIEDFITEHGYSPSYREIMQGTGHTSVATVSLHVNNLIKRGHLAKRNRSARSLEVVKPGNAKAQAELTPKQLKASEEKWLVRKVELFFKEAEASPGVSEPELDKLYVLIGALKVLGLEGAAQSFIARLSQLKKRQADNQYLA
jgi:sulfur relay (sulfurtransferase) DsrC/TusE family protein